MKKLFKFMRPYRLFAILGPLFKLIEACLELLVPIVIAKLIDNGIEGGDTSYIVNASLFLALLGFVGLAFSITAQYFSAKTAVGVVADMRSSLFAHIMGLSYSDIDRLGTATMISRITSDADKVQTGLNLALRLLLRSPFVVFGAMVMAFFVDADSAITFAVTIPALAVVVYGLMFISFPLYKSVQAKLDGVLSKTRENLSGARVVRAFCKEDEEISEFREKNNSLVKVQKLVGAISALLNPLTFVIINLAIVWLIHRGAIQIDSDNLTQGQLIALYNYMSQILVELIKLANLIVSITKSIASASRISAILDIKNSMDNGRESSGVGSDNIIEFSDVSLTYGGAREPSISGVSFKVKRGETVGIIGGTGSGKSTLINLIPRFYDATEGAVLYDGADVKTYDVNALREKIAVVPQRAVLFRGTIRDNLLFGNPNATDEDLLRAIETAQASNIIADKGGLDAKVEEGGKNLSGGQKQRLTIARALVKKPEILILDDSSSALDYATDKALKSAISEYGQDITVFIVSQRSSSVMAADKILVLEDGELVSAGKHTELLEASPVYREIYESQFGAIGGAAL